MNMHDQTRATPGIHHRLLVLAVGFVATVAGLPGHAALVVPPTPLQSATSIPPNIMLILDDSGSMDWDFMPGAFGSDGVPATTPEEIQLLAYPRNTLYYNPAIAYRPWKNQDGVELTGGTSYNAAYSDPALASGTTVDLAGITRTFYVPKAGITDEADSRQYYRYRILTDGTVERSEYGAVTNTSTTASGFPKTGLSGTQGNLQNVVSFTVPANTYEIVVQSSGGSHGTNGSVDNNNGDGADLYVRYNSASVTSTSGVPNSERCSSTTGANNESCTEADPRQGTWYAGLYADSSYKNVTLTVTVKTSDRCGSGTGSNGWINCTHTTPSGRSDAAELANYAIWYSYHRTRIKTAKAGASAAFADLIGDSYRVGYTTIWNRNTKYVPVASNNGLFLDVAAQGTTPASNNRTDWFTRLHAAAASNGTPLQDALKRVGDYYSDVDATYKGGAGPYGPATSNQLACRQNYSILTTDGYWNTSTVDVGNSDNANGPLIAKPGEVAKTWFTTGSPYRDGVKTTLADVAMEYWKKDLMPSMANIVPSSTANPAFWQHMVTFGIALGLQGSLPQKSVPEVIAAGATSFAWPDPTDAEDEHRIDDLLHAAVNGHGTFAAATNPTEFAAALTAALSTITERVNSASNVAVSSASTQGSTRAFVSSYLSGKWTGELVAYPVTSAGVGATPTWRASTTVPSTQRTAVYTVGASNGGTPVSFPKTAQETTLTTAVANYLKGNRTGEGTTYRQRPHLLGDIVNSSPTYVKEGSTETVYVGSNDGMLHAFDATDGSELFTYVPNLIDMNLLKGLSVRDNFVHRFFVDGPVVVSNTTQTPGKNYLVGSLGRGGKGVYGLDVSTPSTFGTTGKAWEYAGDADMGMVLSKPLITKLNNGNMAAIVSNGINSTNGHAVLYVLDLTTGALVKKIDTFKTGDGTENGLAAPTGVDNDGDGDTDYVYAGDLQGNVWKFDLTATAASSWAVAGTGANPLFVATNSAGVRQPITGGVTISFNPYTFQPWVFFGTGRYITSSDKEDLSVQTWYGIVDAGAAISGRSELKQRSILLAGTINDRPVRSFEPAVPGDMNGKKGWYIDLKSPPNGTADGERMVGAQLVVDGTNLLASSIIPQSSDCDVSGKGFVNVVDLYSGGSVESPFFDASGDGQYGDADKLTTGTGAKVPVGSIDPGVGMPTDPAVLDNLIIVGGSSGGTPAKIPYKRLIQDGRISWREILKD